MHYYLVGVAKQAVKEQPFLTYSYDEELEIGSIVLVPLRNSSAIGVVFKKVVQPSFKTRPITKLVNDQPLPKHLLKITSWISDYYCTPTSQVLVSVLPTGLNKKRRSGSKIDSIKTKDTNSQLTPTTEQSRAVSLIKQSPHKTLLLHGVTGSGKTTVYIELVRDCLKSGHSAIIIVPEIALTAQLISQFAAHFQDIVLLHSKLTESQRHLNWLRCLTTSSPQVIIGARSAIFAPVKQIGLIVVDECHESSLKQDKNPRYSTSRVAGAIAKMTNAKLVLGSATPLVSDYFLIKKISGEVIELTGSAMPTEKPSIELIDMTKKANFSQHSFLSDALMASIKWSLDNKEQALLFHNRRGSSSATLCRDCGWLAMCQNCQVPLILHHDRFNLTCHVCGHKEPIPFTCPDCGSSNIDHAGIGTKLIEKEITKHFPEANIARFDGDSGREQTVDKYYDRLVSGEIDILIGTQVVAKGLNLPKLSTVGIIQADTGLTLPDFVTEERNFQQITQVIGRVGRNDKKTRVIVQTYRPQQPSIRLGITQDYAQFYKDTVSIRKKLNYPPFSFLLKLKVSYKTEAACIKDAKSVANLIGTKFPGTVVIGPAPAFYERRNGLYNWQIIVKSKHRPDLQKIITILPKTHWQYDIDPESLL